MLIAEEKLAVEVTQVDRIEVYDVDFAKSSEDEVFEELATDTSSSYHQYARLPQSQYLGRKAACGN